MTAPTGALTFANLFAGRTDAYGLGRGQVVREPLTLHMYAAHLRGEDSGIGVFPLRDDGTVSFAAIDLDEPDFDLARDLAEALPGAAFVERSRSGNAHVWAFFVGDYIEAWKPRGVMKMTLEGFGRPDVEVFPKQDALREGMLGNYINLPYHGSGRPMLSPGGADVDLSSFLAVAAAAEAVDNVAAYDKRARALKIGPPAPVDRSDFGDREQLHCCAEYIYEHRHDHPLAPGHRAVVLFNVAKQLANWRSLDAGAAARILHEINDAAEKPLPHSEIDRMLTSAVRGQYTSTGCDDALMQPYVHPDCPIAHG